MPGPDGRNRVGRRAVLMALSGGVAVAALGGCRPAQGENPAGYPPIARGQAAASAPTHSGPVPTPVGAGPAPGVAAEEGSDDGPDATALGASAGDPGLYEMMDSVGMASIDPTPVPTATPRPTTTVTVTEQRGFEPAQVTINRGQAVLWRNAGRAPQTVTANPVHAGDQRRVALPQGAEPFESPVLNAGDSFSHRFDVPGEYVYVSTTLERRGLAGRVTVR